MEHDQTLWRELLSQALARFGAPSGRRDEPHSAPTPEADTRERMRALGYAD